MSSRTERARRQVIDSGSPLARHSLNQKKVKASLDGEIRLGFEEASHKSDFSRFLERFSSDDVYLYLLNFIEDYDMQTLSLPSRIGNLSFEICRLINNWMNEDPERFLKLESWRNITHIEGSPNARLISVPPVASAVLKDLGYQFNIENVRNLNGVARSFVKNLGSVRFYETNEVAAVDAFYTLYNLSGYIAGQINAGNIDLKHARKGVISFGKTIRDQLLKR